MSQFLGQLVPAPSVPDLRGLSARMRKEIKEEIQRLGGFRGRAVEVLVTSKNALKMQAAKGSVEAWLQTLFNERVEVAATGYGVPSGIDEQPHGLAHTISGAVNRLENMKAELIRTKGARSTDGVLRILISLENGLMLEPVNSLENPQIFKTKEGTVWVDRCVEVGEIWLQEKTWKLGALSEGVTTPKEQVEESLNTNWMQTAGSFIAKKYGWNAADWHGSIAGKGRQIIMEELAKAGLNVIHAIPIPRKTRAYDPRDIRYHHYVTETVQSFTPTELENLLDLEIRKQREKISLDCVEESVIWRDSFTLIPQPTRVRDGAFKPVLGPDNKTPIYSSGPILTEDLMMGYFDEVEDPITHEIQDVLHIVLLWADEGGWVLPGKRDRAYDLKNPDISVKDANYSLVEKEIGISRSEVPYHFLLGYFDDRKREQRMKASGFLSFVLLNQRPQLDGRRIGVPLNALVQLAQGEIVIPPTPEHARSGVLGTMARNHDSLILNVLKTAAFYQAMEKVKHAQVKFRDLLKANPHAVRPALSDVDEGFECSVCLDLLVKVTSICEKGHLLCGLCLPTIQQANSCPECRQPIRARAIPQFETVIQQRYPVKYAERYVELTGAEPRSWKDDPAFNGTLIQFKS